MNEVDGWGYDAVAIVRPTSPFLSVESVRRGVELYDSWKGEKPLRAMRYVDVNPMKMWRDDGNHWVKPVMQEWADLWLTDDYECADADVPWDGPTDPDPSWLVQTGGLDIVPIDNLKRRCLVGNDYPRNGRHVGWLPIPLVLEGIESLDVNTEDDWQKAECLIRCEMAAAARAADPGIGGTGWAMGG